MSPSKNQFSVTALIQALERELEQQIEILDPSEKCAIYFASRRKVLARIVAELRRAAPEEDTLSSWLRFSSALIAGIKTRTAYLQQPMIPAARAAALGELAGMRVVLEVLRRLLDE